MSHVPGHIDDLPTSFGKLHLAVNEDDPKGTTKVEFIAPPFTLTKGMKVGFHPIFKDAAKTDILAIDLVDWNDHVAAEEILRLKLPAVFNKIEEIGADADKKGKVEGVLAMGGLDPKYANVIRKTLDYFKLKDFAVFYKKGGRYDSANAEQKIIDTLGVSK